MDMLVDDIGVGYLSLMIAAWLMAISLGLVVRSSQTTYETEVGQESANVQQPNS
jgi:hypothetical protein